MGAVTSRLRRPNAPVSITYTTSDGGNPQTEEFDFVVVACDPRGLKITDRTDFEEEIIRRLTSHTFKTSLLFANRPNRDETVPVGGTPNGPPQTNYAVRFDPVTLERMDGGVYGFRDEIMARDTEFQPSHTKTTWTVVYQLAGVPLIGKDRAAVKEAMNLNRDKALKTDKWIDWDPANEVPAKELLVDYFGHFLQDGLRDKLPWKIVDEQGKNKTLYVASFTCFESVLHCYLYQNMLMARSDVRDRFPKKKNARIAVIGAGPSGLLFASQHLVAKGYKNFKIFEASDRYGGKTETQYQQIPGREEDGGTVPCELGTCYLSPAYFPLYSLFEKYNAGKVVALDRDSNAFRSIIDPDIAENEQEKMDGVEYGAWATFRKNDYATPEVGEQRILRASVLYVLFHLCAMGMDPEDPMPKELPTVKNVVGNLLSIVAWMIGNLDDISELVESFSLSTLFKGILGRGGAFDMSDKGVKDDVDLFADRIERIDLDIDLHDIVRLFSIDIFKKTFEQFLDEADMGDLKPTLVYAYQGAFSGFFLLGHLVIRISDGECTDFISFISLLSYVFLFCSPPVQGYGILVSCFGL